MIKTITLFFNPNAHLPTVMDVLYGTAFDFKVDLLNVAIVPKYLEDSPSMIATVKSECQFDIFNYLTFMQNYLDGDA